MTIKPKFDFKKFRSQRNLTQDELAYMLGFSRSHIATIETGRQGVSTGVMHALIETFGIAYEDFYDHKDSG